MSDLRVFPVRPLSVCYNKLPDDKCVDRSLYLKLREEALNNCVEKITVPKRSAKAWKMNKGDLCRMSVVEGSQVGDVNFWNLDNTAERFYSGKTRQIHATHLTTFDRLWSCIPYLRPMATIVADTLAGYGIDEDGGSVHDVIGTRCDQYTSRMITGEETVHSCHNYLTEAVLPYGLKETDVHDVFNIFMCTGFTKDTHKYFCKASPGRKGDYIEFIAEMNLLVALSACPKGDVSVPVGVDTPESMCFPLGVEVFRAKTPTVTLPNH